MHRKKDMFEKYSWKKINIFGAEKISATQIPQANKMTNKSLATSGCFRQIL